MNGGIRIDHDRQLTNDSDDGEYIDRGRQCMTTGVGVVYVRKNTGQNTPRIGGTTTHSRRRRRRAAQRQSQRRAHRPGRGGASDDRRCPKMDRAALPAQRLS